MFIEIGRGASDATSRTVKRRHLPLAAAGWRPPAPPATEQPERGNGKQPLAYSFGDTAAFPSQGTA
jgi:hypothetical protein